MVLDPSRKFLYPWMFVMMEIEDFEKFLDDPTWLKSSPLRNQGQLHAYEYGDSRRGNAHR